jgi:hypothetical protein
MKRFILLSLAACLGWGAVGERTAWAQQTVPYNRPNYGPGYRPQLSPYLNFLRGGDPAANYFLGTLPEIQRRTNAQVFSSSILDLENRTAQQPTGGDGIFNPLGTSGHPTAFNNTAGYFNQMNPRIPGGAAQMPSSRMPKAR